MIRLPVAVETTMKRLFASLALLVATAVLAGCYYDPGYSYVRGSSYGGDAYYGQGDAYGVAPAYYGGYYGGYYPGYSAGYYGYGCCYAPGVTIGISRGWYGGQDYRGYRNRDYGMDRDHRYRGSHGGRDGAYRAYGNAGGPRLSQPRQQASPRGHGRTQRNDASRNRDSHAQ